MIKKVAGIDIETTGLKQEDGHRIIEIGISVYVTSNGIDFKKIGNTWCQRINPMRSIDAKAQLVHGISLQDLKLEPEWEVVSKKVHKILSQVDLLVAHNMDFDGPFVGLELARVGLPIPNFDTFCTLEHGRSATSMGKVPNLGELCWAFGIEYDGEIAHAADYDIDRTMECFFEGVRKGVFEVPLFSKLSQTREAA